MSPPLWHFSKISSDLVAGSFPNDVDDDDGGGDKSNDSDDGDDAPIWKPPNLYDPLTRLTSVSPLHSRTIATVSGIFCRLLSFSKDFYVSYIFE